MNSMSLYEPPDRYLQGLGAPPPPAPAAGQPSFFAKYKWYIIGGSALVAVGSLLWFSKMMKGASAAPVAGLGSWGKRKGKSKRSRRRSKR